MGIGKWIGGILGWIVAGPLGALAGVALGSLFDTDNMLEEPSSGWNGQRTQGGGSTYNSNPFNTGQRNSFLFSLLLDSKFYYKVFYKYFNRIFIFL